MSCPSLSSGTVLSGNVSYQLISYYSVLYSWANKKVMKCWRVKIKSSSVSLVSIASYQRKWYPAKNITFKIYVQNLSSELTG